MNRLSVHSVGCRQVGVLMIAMEDNVFFIIIKLFKLFKTNKELPQEKVVTNDIVGLIQ